MPGHNAGRAPRKEGMVYPADPPTVDEIVAVMCKTPSDRHGIRLRALIVVLWRGGLRIQEALSLIESDLDPRRGAILVRRGKGNKRREVGMDSWAWSDHLAPWLAGRAELPGGALFSLIDGPTRGRPWSATAVRGECAGMRSRPVCAVGSPRTSSAMRTPSSSLGRPCRCPSSSGSSGPACRASIPKRSSGRSAHVALR